MHHRRSWFLVVVALAVLTALSLAVAAFADDPQPVEFTHSSLDAGAPVPGGVFGSGPSFKTGQAVCTTPTQSVTANVNTDCDASAPNGVTNPHNETSIAVNPTNTQNIVGGANDYQLGINPGGQVSETLRSFAHVSFDGGATWSEYPVNSNSSYQATGDPAVAFDATGHAYYATLGFRFAGPFNATNPDILVSNSGDGGRTWETQRIAAGSGSEVSVGDLLDKEYIAAWGAGNAIVTYGDFRLVQHGAFATAQIYASVTHDYGRTWSKPQLISGSLDQAFASVPTVAADGSIYVAFMNTDFLTAGAAFGRDVYYVVKVNPATGTAIGSPVPVGTVYDGNYDYPWALGRPTYQDSAFRTWAAGNITADPTRPGHLAVVWSDMRNSPNFFPTLANPYEVTTNSDVAVSESFNGGATWSPPTAIARTNDQFMPWAAFDGSGALRIGTFDRSYDGPNHKYGYSLATAAASNTPATAFGFVQVATALSDPTRDDRWFRATLDPDFPRASSFIGDYSNIAVVPTGTAGTGIGLGTSIVAYWTDMRNAACFPAGVCGWGEDAYFGRVG